MRILVLRGGALGDFLVTLPALQLLRRRWPQARIELVGNTTAGELGVLGGLLDAVHSQHEARWAALFEPAPLSLALAARLAAFDLVINFWPDSDGALARHFPRRPDQPFVSGSPTPTIAPAARHFCEPLRALGLVTNDYRCRLRLPPSGHRLSTPDPRPLVAVHPGSGSPRKNWPAERWLELIRRLDGPILLVLGDAETSFLDDWHGRFANVSGLRLADRLPLPELATLLSRCRLFLGHDSGVSHLAATVGTPCVLLFGPTDPAMWAPPGDHVRVIRRGASLEAISVDDILASLPAEGRGGYSGA